MIVLIALASLATAARAQGKKKPAAKPSEPTLTQRVIKAKADVISAANNYKESLKKLLDLQETLRRMIGVLDEAMKPDGYNVGLNLGRVAGAGLPGHLHWHIVPRWNGDTNFMPVLGDVKVIAQSLDALYDLLVNKLQP